MRGGPKVRVGDLVGENSDASVDAPPQETPTVETLSSSNASSPTAFKLEDNKEHHHDHDEESEQRPSNQITNDPSRISWESGSVPSTSSPSRVTIKLLVSNNMAGSIIGRQGQTVSELQNKSSAKIRLSQSGDYFPGTTDRVCLIHGSLENVKRGVALILGKLYELQLELVETQLGATEQIHSDLDKEPNDPESSPKINFTARILVPSAACGMLIGKEGSTIQRLKENAEASSVRLSPKVVDHSLPRTFERVLTVSAFELQACISFGASILDGFVRHPEICRYLNGTTSYSRNSNVSYNAQRNPSVMGYHGSASPPPTATRQTFSHSHGSRHDVESSLQGLGFESNLQGTHSQRSAFISASSSAMGTNSMGSSPSQVSTFLPQRSSSSTPSPSYTTTINLAVPDSMVGAVLGRRGQALQELQSESGARIKVSQRNEFVPGTTNRIVTVSGSQDSVATARNMIRELLSRNP